jgi:hypothetical protein
MNRLLTLLIGTILLVGCLGTSARPNDGDIPVTTPTRPGGYENRILGFRITPPKGWALPSGDDIDPHFCVSRTDEHCKGFEIQAVNEGTRESSLVVMQRFRKEKLKPVLLNVILPGTIVIRSLPEGPAEGWSTMYYAFVEQTGQQFIMFSNDSENFEKNILPTFEALE